MKEFRAFLRPPKRELWLGAIVKSVEDRLTKLSRMPYIRVRFENVPFICSYYPDESIKPGTIMHIDVKWVVWGSQLYPNPRPFKGAIYNG